MIKLTNGGYGRKNSIMQLIMAGASVDTTVDLNYVLKVGISTIHIVLVPLSLGMIDVYMLVYLRED